MSNSYLTLIKLIELWNSKLIFVYYKALLKQTIYTSFWLQNNLCEFTITTREHKFKRWFLYSKISLNVRFKDFWYWKINLSQKYILLKIFIQDLLKVLYDLYEHTYFSRKNRIKNTYGDHNVSVIEQTWMPCQFFATYFEAFLYNFLLSKTIRG